MNQLTKFEEMKVNFSVAREFIEEKLGIAPTNTNIKLFVKYILVFEAEVNSKPRKKPLLSLWRRAVGTSFLWKA